MKLLKIILIAILSAGSLAAESIITLTRQDALTQSGAEEFGDSLKMVLDDAFKSAVIKEIEKTTSEGQHEGLSQYIDLNFIPYQSTITVKGKGGHSALIEKAFAETFIKYRLNTKIEKSMKPVETARIELDRMREQLSDANLDSTQKSELQRDIDTKSKELKQLMLKVTSKASPQWVFHGSK